MEEVALPAKCRKLEPRFCGGPDHSVCAVAVAEYVRVPVSDLSRTVNWKSPSPKIQLVSYPAGTKFAALAGDIDRARMQLRVPLSKCPLKEVVGYWLAQRRGYTGEKSPWLFLGETVDEPIGISSARMIITGRSKGAA